MRILSLRQPWAHAVLNFGKRIENRRVVTGGKVKPPTWHAYRGPILLHASKGRDEDEHHDAFMWMVGAFGMDSAVVQSIPELGAMQRGGIVGRARVVDVIPPATSGYTSGMAECVARSRADAWHADHRWWMRDQFGFVLADVEPLPFFACRGALGLWEPTPEILAHVAAHDVSKGATP